MKLLSGLSVFMLLWTAPGLGAYQALAQVSGSRGTSVPMGNISSGRAVGSAFVTQNNIRFMEPAGAVEAYDAFQIMAPVRVPNPQISGVRRVEITELPQSPSLLVGEGRVRGKSPTIVIPTFVLPHQGGGVNWGSSVEIISAVRGSVGRVWATVKPMVEPVRVALNFNRETPRMGGERIAVPARAMFDGEKKSRRLDLDGSAVRGSLSLSSGGSSRRPKRSVPKETQPSPIPSIKEAPGSGGLVQPVPPEDLPAGYGRGIIPEDRRPKYILRVKTKDASGDYIYVDTSSEDDIKSYRIWVIPPGQPKEGLEIVGTEREQLHEKTTLLDLITSRGNFRISSTEKSTWKKGAQEFTLEVIDLNTPQALELISGFNIYP
ncbi:MAG: hypothetical protein HY399_04505 [Elusimicrobia bacterium]|nr:hypothetical protein [Elusimicrobiota bacterium]